MMEFFRELKEILPAIIVMLTISSTSHLTGLVGLNVSFEPSWLWFTIWTVTLCVITVLTIRIIQKGEKLRKENRK